MNEKSVKWVSVSVSQIFKCTFAASRWGRAGNAEKKRQKNGRRGIGCASVCLVQWWAPPPLPSSSSRLFARLLLASLPFPSSLPFSNPLPKPVVFQLFSQKTSPTERLVARTRDCPPRAVVTGARFFHPMGGRFCHRSQSSPGGKPVFSTGHTSHLVDDRFCRRSYLSPGGWPVFPPVIDGNGTGARKRGKLDL